MNVSAAVTAFILLGCLLFPASVYCVPKMSSTVRVSYIDQDFSASELDGPRWRSAHPVKVGTYWSGADAPVDRHFEARLLWSKTALYVRFAASQNESLVVSPSPDLSKKTLQLWDRDVSEIFIAPDRHNRNKYFEFEIAPTGEWIDLGIEVTSQGRNTDWDYKSGMTSAARIGKSEVVMAIKIPWKALGRTPRKGDVWLGNLFRCVGKDPGRGYLAWRPTRTRVPSFHVPETFGELVFG